jgi:hypothetical protein
MGLIKHNATAQFEGQKPFTIAAGGKGSDLKLSRARPNPSARKGCRVHTAPGKRGGVWCTSTSTPFRMYKAVTEKKPPQSGMQPYYLMAHGKFCRGDPTIKESIKGPPFRCDSTTPVVGWWKLPSRVSRRIGSAPGSIGVPSPPNSPPKASPPKASPPPSPPKSPELVNGGWSDWGPWGDCVNGKRRRARTCSNPVPQGGGMRCIGESMEYSDCEEPAPTPPPSRPASPVATPPEPSPPPPAVDPSGWSAWSAWSECVEGESRRTRTCNSDNPQHCAGQTVDIRDCTVRDDNTNDGGSGGGGFFDDTSIDRVDVSGDSLIDMRGGVMFRGDSEIAGEASPDAAETPQAPIGETEEVAAPEPEEKRYPTWALVGGSILLVGGSYWSYLYLQRNGYFVNGWRGLPAQIMQRMRASMSS